MAEIVLVTGGARSGKSDHAERRAAQLGRPGIYIATAQAFDAEMEDRIARHRMRRDGSWRTEEVPLALVEALRATDGEGVRLVDCLTLWLSNLMGAGADPASEADALAECLQAQASPVILVTNEVGQGIVPDNPLARRFRDAAGLMNQRIARVADEVVLVVAGLPMVLKSSGRADA
ncbi:MAG TPA: bifunctional adenosylcobinamide kinase/adenosylcobinamide-phosphate guanylyltransferase [Amaricoccus sp.]|uniref:bifunctional adenosylcobinamide kinase/adenosylcobinamide-phosphate guanylyltransferase n=1 Tax=Amaricoccus sp. TaxID=1872485 RepID=UPI001DA9DBC9|nr:bifunctional adenosylcobinamide kinase/adenosylcobinamide-phosphate guanylyltransferase [Amaricoccus sp.]MCB1372775.1 bifunctional adenosylcobinamide kinase/adenosylcobinamide-phosphate guanylyltransferase [Paracoccaceae bacterium]MCB1401938.1 bifunctional adenosylcobinamide kinase/adenosylcobinamide-phosphate guanylyltransferase [Paracoccaceae bacterium]HPG21218.1 bifunctional adenosylcobinamide kinase/adenosylcobinamide-phosphate guanylyltransferase [Amaricoccus sp.]HRW13900.1 bifunctional